MFLSHRFPLIGVARRIGLPAFIAASGSRDVVRNSGAKFILGGQKSNDTFFHFQSLFIFLLLLLTIPFNVFSYRLINIGPTVHLTLSKPIVISYAIETSLWFYPKNNQLAKGIDFGLEIDHKKPLPFRFYSDIQLFYVYAGASFGPVLEFNKNTPTFAFQSSFFSASPIYRIQYEDYKTIQFISLAADLRLRLYHDYKLFSLGLFNKFNFSNEILSPYETNFLEGMW